MLAQWLCGVILKYLACFLQTKKQTNKQNIINKYKTTATTKVENFRKFYQPF